MSGVLQQGQLLIAIQREPTLHISFSLWAMLGLRIFSSSCTFICSLLQTVRSLPEESFLHLESLQVMLIPPNTVYNTVNEVF